MMGTGEKPRNIQKMKQNEKNSHPHVYEMEADCFPVSENTENKLDLP